jgi:transaldolase
MQHETYLDWAIGNTATTWWHDSADPAELERGLEHGAVGVTTNPVLSFKSLTQNRQLWSGRIDEVLARKLGPDMKAEELVQIAVTETGEKLLGIHEKTGGQSGFVCAQVNPGRPGDREYMQAMAERFTKWAPNIAVKLPVTAAGLDVLEECAAKGITVTLTVSFTVPQVIAIAERFRKGLERAKKNGVKPGKCFAVIMIGRLDDYIRDVAHDGGYDVSEEDIRWAGLAVTKRSCAIFKERGYEAELIVAALRGTYHMTEICGAEVIMSIAVPYQKMLLVDDLPQEERIDEPVAADVIERLSRVPEFVRAYDPDGMREGEFISYGVSQRTLSQFYEAGWRRIEGFGG